MEEFGNRICNSVLKISTQDRTHANKPRNEHTNEDTDQPTTDTHQARLIFLNGLKAVAADTKEDVTLQIVDGVE